MAPALQRQRNWARLVIAGEDGGATCLDPTTLVALHAGLDEADRIPDLRCLVLELSECLGAPLGQLGEAQDDDLRRQAGEFVRLLQRLHDRPAPVLLRAGGRIMGGAVGLAAACDIVLCRPDARFSLPEAGGGMAPILIAPWLTRRIGAARFRVLAISGLELSAAEAVQAGLADGVFDGDGFPPAYARLLRSAPAAVARIKALSRLDAGGAAVEAFLAYLSAPEVKADIALVASGGSPAWRRKQTSGS